MYFVHNSSFSIKVFNVTFTHRNRIRLGRERHSLENIHHVVGGESFQLRSVARVNVATWLRRLRLWIMMIFLATDIVYSRARPSEDDHRMINSPKPTWVSLAPVQLRWGKRAPMEKR